jgi:elongator complex protein 3 (tRNA carboxymethyluridine synthase)
MDCDPVLREIISRISSTPSPARDIPRIKREVCRRYGTSPIPRNSAILAAATPEEREWLRPLLQMKPTRTRSGVAPVAVMTSPAPCPHGKCLPCPGGPDHPFGTPQSYTGEEPAALRAREHHYDPYRQVTARLTQFEALGHPVDKAELILMGGTITARPAEYQRWCVASCLEALNAYRNSRYLPDPDRPFSEIEEEQEKAQVRCVAMTFETRPDWCRQQHIDLMRDLGVTKVELGVQQLDNRILALNRRGCTVEDTVTANRLLRDQGFKVGFHVMPNLPGATLEDDRAMFRHLFSDERFQPDFLKIYPTLVTPGSQIEGLWQRGEYRPYPEEDLVDLVAYAKSLLPPWVRLQRVQRDIPAWLITAGSRHSNFRQLARERLEEGGLSCRCIRCREAGRVETRDEPALSLDTYRCCHGEEHFLSMVSGDALIGFARLRFPSRCMGRIEEGTALIRELHVYGNLVPLGVSPAGGEWQHREYGRRLLAEAERMAAGAGYRRLAILAGIGVRPYYRRLGYSLRHPYMEKALP